MYDLSTFFILLTYFAFSLISFLLTLVTLLSTYRGVQG